MGLSTAVAVGLTVLTTFVVTDTMRATMPVGDAVEEQVPVSLQMMFP